MTKAKPPPEVVKIMCKVCGKLLAVPKKEYKANRYYFCPFPCFYVFDKIAKGWSDVEH